MAKKSYSKFEVDMVKYAEYKKGLDDGTDRALQQLILIPLLYLRDKEGYGSGRLEKFIDYFKFNLDCIDDDRVSLNDIADVLENETGIGFKGIIDRR